MILTNLTPSLNTPCPPQLPRRSLHNKKKNSQTHTGSPSPLRPFEQWHHFGFGVFEMESGLRGGARRKWEQTISWQTNELHSNWSYDVSLQSGRPKERNEAENMENWRTLAAKLDEYQRCLSKHIYLSFSLPSLCNEWDPILQLPKNNL